jgi:uncharacterized pyridoxal phosphate-dependent enzyme
MDRAVIPTTNLFERYGLRRIINASGTETTKGASPVCPEVIAAVSALVPHSVEMAELQSVACSVIARSLGAEAGCVVNCTAAGISVAVAACMTGRDLARVEQLPDATGMKSAVVMQRGHVVTYGGYVTQNVRLAGARVVEIGAATECGAYHLRAALGPDTACALYVVSHHTVQSGLLDLATFCAVCHEKGVPVIVDAAAEPDPRSYLEAGADVVILSAQKRLAGLTAGVVAGRMELVRACMYQEKGIGRPMKVGKEGVIATIAALERWMSIDKARAAQELAARLGRAKERLAGIPGVRAALEVDSTTPTFSRLHLYVDAGQAGFSALELSQALWNRRPSIFVRNLMADVGLLQVDLRLISDETAALICDAVIEEARALRNGPPRQQGEAASHLGPHPNLADAALASLERWPLPLKPGQ